MNLCLDAEIVGPWVCEKTGGSWCRGRGTAIGQLKDGILVAGVLYEDCSGPNVVCHIAGLDSWATRSFLSVIFDYPFNQLGVKRITVPVASSNAKSVRLVEGMGFRIEARLHQATPDGDLLIYRLFRDECKYIKGKYAWANQVLHHHRTTQPPPRKLQQVI